jgi:hypothetical protein
MIGLLLLCVGDNQQRCRANELASARNSAASGVEQRFILSFNRAHSISSGCFDVELQTLQRLMSCIRKFMSAIIVLPIF